MLATIIILTVIGLLLVFAEIYIPGAILGTLGALCLIGAIGASYYEYGFGVGSFMLVAISIVSLASVALGLKLFPNTPLGRQLQLSSSLDAPSEHPDHRDLVGRTGQALTSLRPSGAASIDGRRIDVVSQGGMIDSGARIKVVHTEGARVVVREIDADDLDEQPG